MGTILSNLFGTNHGFISSLIGTNQIYLLDIKGDQCPKVMARSRKNSKSPRKQPSAGSHKTLTRNQKRTERRLKSLHGVDYVPRHLRVLKNIRQVVEQEFPSTDMTASNKAQREFWQCRLGEIDSELTDEYFEVFEIVDERTVPFGEDQACYQLDVRYKGYEETVCWQPYEFVSNLAVYKQFVIDKSHYDGDAT